MNPEDLGRDPAENPPPSAAAPKASSLGPQSHSDSGGSPPQATVDALSANQAERQANTPQPFKGPDFGGKQPANREFHSGHSSGVRKSNSAPTSDAPVPPATVPETRAAGAISTQGRSDFVEESMAPLVLPDLSITANADRSADSAMPAVHSDLKPSEARVQGGQPHISPKKEMPLDVDAQLRVSEGCKKRRRKYLEIKDFPRCAKPDWLGRLFCRTGRILIECSPPSDTDPWRQAWFIGDVHGDLVGLLAALDFIHHHSEYEKEDIIVLLGDLIDDLPESEAVLAEVSERLDNGERLIVIVGNHDDALKYIENRGFGASVDPCDYCEELKRIADSGPEHSSLGFARSFIRYMSDAPVALFLNDGTMAAHGGVPHTDLAEKVSREEWGEDPEVWSDFIWARLHPRAKSRMAVTGTRSRELGADDFRQFASAVKVNLKFEPVRMIRGHDHIDARFEIYGGKWRGTVLTINNMSWKLPREAGVDGPRNPCIARWNRGKPIQPIVILMDSLWRESMQPGSPE